MRILLIDDDELIRSLIGTILVEAGHAVVTAVNGTDGIDKLRGEKFDLVVTDILMPDKEGVETIFEVRKTWPELRIIAISGGGMVKNFKPLSIAKKAGADVVLTKPFEPEDLLNAVKTVSRLPANRAVEAG